MNKGWTGEDRGRRALPSWRGGGAFMLHPGSGGSIPENRMKVENQ